MPTLGGRGEVSSEVGAWLGLRGRLGGLLTAGFSLMAAGKGDLEAG